jgi:hypothetical protein
MWYGLISLLAVRNCVNNGLFRSVERNHKTLQCPREKISSALTFWQPESLGPIRQLLWRQRIALLCGCSLSQLWSTASKLPSTEHFNSIACTIPTTMKNVVFCDINAQFVLHRRHVTSPQQSSASKYYIWFELFTAAAMKNVVFWDIKSQFVPRRRHIKSPLQSPAG